MRKGFNTIKYLQIQKREILKRVKKFDRLYLEVGGHLFYDGHASRVLPGYNPKTKVELLQTLSKKLGKFDIIYCISSQDLASKKHLNDSKINYKKQTFLDLSLLEKAKLNIESVVITRYKTKYSQEVRDFKKVLESMGKRVYIHNEITNYSKSPKYAVRGYALDDYVRVYSKLVVVTGVAGGSGKMATVMSQIYHDVKNKLNSGYAKLETFPIWNLPLNHPINLAYEAATADLQDKNMIDCYHWEHYKKIATNYNRDIENFSILMKIAQIITKKKNAFGYYSPTDMGMGNTKAGIINNRICRLAAIKEIKRRMDFYLKEFKAGRESKKTIDRMHEIMGEIE